MGANERVILIKGDENKWYNQAIFIVNKELPSGKIPVDFVAEAEKIISSYLQKKKPPAFGVQQQFKPKPLNALRPAAKNKRFDFFINICMFLGCAMIVAALAFGLAN